MAIVKVTDDAVQLIMVTSDINESSRTSLMHDMEVGWQPKLLWCKGSTWDSKSPSRSSILRGSSFFAPSAQAWLPAHLHYLTILLSIQTYHPTFYS